MGKAREIREAGGDPGNGGSRGRVSGEVGGGRGTERLQSPGRPPLLRPRVFRSDHGPERASAPSSRLPRRPGPTGTHSPPPRRRTETNRPLCRPAQRPLRARALPRPAAARAGGLSHHAAPPPCQRAFAPAPPSSSQVRRRPRLPVSASAQAPCPPTAVGHIEAGGGGGQA